MGPKSKELPRRRKKVARKQLRVAPYFVSLLVVAGLLWLAAFAGTGFKSFPIPKLGLDLQGGMTMTLKASLPNNGTPDAARLEQARQIIEDRVNGTGVAEPEVYVEGSNHIVVNVAGKEANAEKLREVGAPAELRFREVLAGPGEDYTQQDPEDFKKETQEDKDKDKDKESDKDSSDEEKADNPSDDESSKDDKSESPSDDKSSKDDDKDKGEDPADVDNSVKEQRKKLEKKLGKELIGAAEQFVAQAEAMVKQGQQLSPQMFPQLGYTEDFAKFGKLSPDEVAVLAPSWQYYIPNIGCGQLNGRTPGAISEIKEQVVACNRPSDADIKAAKKQKQSAYTKYLMAEAKVVGEDISNATVQPDQQQAGAYAVGISFTDSGASKWKKLATATVGKNVSIVLDNEVVSAPTIEQGAGSGGSVEITGGFSSDDANLLAEQLKYGSLPASFTVETIDEVSPTLGLSQMYAGLLAGGVGVALVILYCLVYYRLMGFVVIVSLLVSGAVLYPAIAMLGAQIGFTLTLAGVAGFIVAIGITADSFVVFFERLKDEVKEGRSSRSAVPRAWTRARRTILSANTVQIIGALVLYFVAIGAIKGFAFTLGLSTLFDILVVFLFTHPLVSWVSRSRILDNPFLSGLHTGRRRTPASVSVRGAVSPKES